MLIRRTLIFRIIILSVFLLLLLMLAGRVSAIFRSADKSAFDLNDSINNQNKLFARGNPFGFTDKVRTAKKPRGVFRIAVLGDSFIWGDGLPYQQAWGHKLEQKLIAANDSIEVLNWGIPGWSTLDEFNFFKQHGKDYDIDLLVIGWVDNDPDVGAIQQVYADPQKSYPLIFSIYPALARALENQKSFDLYNAWFARLYEPENLDRYKTVLNDFHAYLTNNKIKCIVIMTPGTGLDEVEDKCFTKAELLIKNAGFDCLNLFPNVQKKFGHYDTSSLRANAANGHPGSLLTEEYANEVKQYLENKELNCLGWHSESKNN